MQRIRITRDSNNNVDFETVSIDNTENVFFINLDPEEAHWPTIASNQVGAAPSAPSSECQPDPTGTKTQVVYQCQIPGHTGEQGIINIFAPLTAATTTLSPAIAGTPIGSQQVVQGGVPPYTITDELFEVAGPVAGIDGSGIGPGLKLTQDKSGIFVSGTPTASGTYTFTFTVDDAVGANLQQIQYTMVVS